MIGGRPVKKPGIPLQRKMTGLPPTQIAPRPSQGRLLRVARIWET